MKFDFKRNKNKRRYGSRVVSEQCSYDIRFDLGVSPTDLITQIKRIIEMIVKR